MLRLSLCFFVAVCFGGEETVTVSVDALNAQQNVLNSQSRSNEPEPIGIKIKNPRNEVIDYYWWSPNDRKGIYQGKIMPYSVTATNSYIGHIFYFTKNKQDEEFFRINVVRNENLYLLPPDNPQDPRYLEMLKEMNFMKDYLNRTGKPWLAHYPRDPPKLYMWDADFKDQVHQVESNNGYWTCLPTTNKHVTEEERKKCQSESEILFNLTVLETEPRVFQINNFLSENECDLIIDLARNKIRRSLAGNHGGLVSNTRTSYNTWLGRKLHYVLDTLYRRAGDVLQIDEQLLYPTKNVEQLQVLHYAVGQEYTPHHDFGASGVPQQRMITLLLYLNDQENPQAGGETSFPKAKSGYTKVHPGKGNAILFYSMLPDGNADDLSLHAALPVKHGEKWLANFWIWDPHR